MMNLDESISETLPSVVELRHALHRVPELRFKEERTSRLVQEFLKRHGVPGTGVSVSTGHAGGTGLVVELHGERARTRAPRTVLLRADIDALEVEEKTGLPYASTIPGQMHACGHDGHTACLCGAALVLHAHRGELPGNVRLVFQPGEEHGLGGRQIVQEGLLAGVDAAFALHAWPGLPAGSVAVREGPFMAGSGYFQIEVTGAGCHGADPSAGVDPVVVAAHIVVALQSIVSREVDPCDAGVVTVGTLQAGTTTNVIPEAAYLAGTLRAHTAATLRQLEGAVKRVAENTAMAFRATAQVFFGISTYPPLVNDEATTRFVRKVAADLIGARNVRDLDGPCMASEDFAFYLEKVPGALLCLGNDHLAGELRPTATLHNPRFDFNDEALPTGIKVLSGIAHEYLVSQAD